MPLTKVDYSKTTIYKIQHRDNDELLYVGSTTDFTRRKAQHKTACNNTNSKSYNIKLYKMMRDNGGFDCFNIIVIKDFPCNTKQEVLIEEDRLIREMKAKLNTIKAFTTPEYRQEQRKKINELYRKQHRDEIAEQQKQCYQRNKDKRIEQQKQYYENHKDEIAEYKKQYNELNKDKIAEQHKQNYERNKDKRIEQVKQYCEKNKEQIEERRKQKITCECGYIIRKDSLARHLKTKTHQNYLLNMTEQ